MFRPLNRYAADNVWSGTYDFKTDGRTSIPLDGRFYTDLFRNGTARRCGYLRSSALFMADPAAPFRADRFRGYLQI